MEGVQGVKRGDYGKGQWAEEGKTSQPPTVTFLIRRVLELLQYIYFIPLA